MSCYCGSKDCPECSPEAKRKWRNDDSNMGHESVPIPTTPMRPRFKTMAYSIVDPEEARKRHGGTALAPTEEMKAIEPMTVRRVISSILETDMRAWKALPTTVQELLLSSPTSFQFHEFQQSASLPLVPDIIYNGVRLRYECEDDKGVWRLYSIGEK